MPASVGLRLVESAELANWHRRFGIARLVALAERRSIRNHVRWFPPLTASTLAVSPWITSAAWEGSLSDILCVVAVQSIASIRTQAEFEAALQHRIAGELAAAAQEIAVWLGEFAEQLGKVRLLLESTTLPALAPTVAEIREQLEQLLLHESLPLIPWEWLQQYPRYFAAILARVDKAKSQLAKDRENAAVVTEQRLRWRQGAETALPPYPYHPRLVELRWLIEELRVSLFAQQLGTRVPVSVKRLEKLWEQIE